MPSRTITPTNAVGGTTIAAAVRTMVHKPTSITYDCSTTVANRTFRIQDIFTPDISDAVPVPVATTVDRHRITVLPGDIVVLDEKDLEGIKCLGIMAMILDALDANPVVSIGWKSE